MEKLMTAQEVATLLGLKPQTIYTYVMKREIPFIKIGKSLRFRASDLENFIEAKAVAV